MGALFRFATPLLPSQPYDLARLMIHTRHKPHAAPENQKLGRVEPADLCGPFSGSFQQQCAPRQGLLMSGVVAVAAPFASEIVLMRLGLWHYPQPDVTIAGQGIVSWVMWCETPPAST